MITKEQIAELKTLHRLSNGARMSFPLGSPFADYVAGVLEHSEELLKLAETALTPNEAMPGLAVDQITEIERTGNITDKPLSAEERAVIDIPDETTMVTFPYGSLFNLQDFRDWYVMKLREVENAAYERCALIIEEHLKTDGDSANQIFLPQFCEEFRQLKS